MKKKFGFVLASILLVCVLLISMVACSPKDPEAFETVDNSATLNEVWDIWAKDNLKLATDTLGVDVNLKLMGFDSNISIILQGGLSQIQTTKDVLRFAVIDNSKTTVNKSLMDIIISNDGLIVCVDEYFEKPIKFSDVKLPKIDSDLPFGITLGNICEMMQNILVPLIANAMDTEGSKVVIDPVLNGKNVYDVNYSFSFKATSIIDGVLEFLNLQNSADIKESIDSVKAQLKDVKIKVSVNTTGNTRKKVEKPAKGAPKYEYIGGSLVDFSLVADNNGSEISINSSASGVKILNSIPEVKIPTDCIEFDSLVLPSNINGQFSMKDSKGNILGNYEYKANFDFNATQIASTLLECITSQSGMPLVNKLFKNNDGKIFVEIKHTCDNSCKFNHLSKLSRPIMTIAYDPQNFGTSRIYFAVNLRGIVTEDFGEKFKELLPAGSQTSAEEIVGLLPEEDLIFSIDPMAYITLDKIQTDITTKAYNMLSAIADSNDKNVIDFAEIINSILQLEELSEYKEIIQKVINLAFPNVDSIEFTAEHTNEHITDINVKEKFMENRTFVFNSDFQEVIAPIASKITFDRIVKEDYYNQDGSLKDLTAEQVLTFIGEKAKCSYKDMLGNIINEDLTIIDIIGLDTQLVGATQKIYLVVNGNLGNNLYKFKENFAKLFGDNIQTESNYKVVDGVIELSITLI